jgi:hypothetical protein
MLANHLPNHILSLPKPPHHPAKPSNKKQRKTSLLESQANFQSNHELLITKRFSNRKTYLGSQKKVNMISNDQKKAKEK